LIVIGRISVPISVDRVDGALLFDQIFIPRVLRPELFAHRGKHLPLQSWLFFSAEFVVTSIVFLPLSLSTLR